MQATKKKSTVILCEKLAVDTGELQTLLGCGRSTAVQIGAMAEAKINVGKRVLWNVNKVQKYLDTIATE